MKKKSTSIGEALLGIMMEAYPFIRVTMFGRGFRKIVKLRASNEEGVVAYTDHDSVVISRNNDFFKDEGLSFKEKVLITKGLLAHEVAHILYTYPRKKNPAIMGFRGRVEDAISLKELLPQTMEKFEEFKADPNFDKSAQVAFLQTVFSQALSLENIMEDGFIEPAWLKNQGSYLHEGLRFLRSYHAKSLSWDEMALKAEVGGQALYNTLCNILLGYGKYNLRPSKELLKKSGALVQTFLRFQGMADATLAEGRSYERHKLQFQLADAVLAEFADIFKESIEQAQGDGGGQAGEGGQGSQSQGGIDAEGNPLSQEAMEELMDELKQSNGSASSLNRPNQEVEAPERPETGGFDGEDLEDMGGEDEAPDSPDRNPDSPDRKGGDQISEELRKMFDSSSDGSTASEKELAEAERLSNLAKLLTGNEVGETSMERAEQRKAEMQAQEALEVVDASEIAVGIHADVACEVFPFEGRDGLYDKFLSQNPDFEERIAKIRREVEMYLHRFTNKVEKRGNYTGSRMDRTAFSRRDKRFYSRTIHPQKKPSIVASILLDISGSTSSRVNGVEVIDYEVFAAVVLAELFTALNIPFAVRSHSTSAGYRGAISQVDIGVAHSLNDAKCNFDNIVSMTPRGANRDGFAMAYALKELQTRREEKKLFFMVSDGAPSDNNYGFQDGKADIQRVMKEHEKNVDIFAFGVGEGVGRLEDIYGERYFDCSDPDKLGDYVVKVIKTALNVI